MNPMDTFNPDVACRVHDGLNDRVFEWRPEWAASYRKHAEDFDTAGVVSWDGLLLDGWVSEEQKERHPISEVPSL